MKPIQIIVLGIAIVAAIGLALVARNMMTAQAPKSTKQKVVVKKAPTLEVLVANERIPMGSSLKKERLAWEEWPKRSVRKQFITRDKKPKALDENAKKIARGTFFPGEPIRKEKLVSSKSGYLSAILPAGKRAVAIRIQAVTSAGGFVLPNDHVDVLMTREDSDNNWIIETVLTNVRILAIDQLVQDKNGKKSKVGDTATLELTKEQTEILTVSQQMSKGNLTLALRSVRDSNPDKTGAANHLLNEEAPDAGTIKIIRYGKTKQVRANK